MMMKVNKWCSHPIRHAGTSKVGCSPSHPKARYRVSLQLVKYLNKQYGVTSANSSQFNIGKSYMCTRCHDYEMDQLKSTQNFPNNVELVNSSIKSVKDTQLRLSIDSLHMQDDFEIATQQESAKDGKCELLSEDGLALPHNQNAVRETHNKVFCILKIQTITDM